MSFDITDDELGISGLRSKIKVYSFRGARDDGPRAIGTWGYINWAHDTNHQFVEPSRILEAAEHECTHVVQFRLGGFYSEVWDWFTEGVAEHISNGGVFPVIACWEEVDLWRSVSGTVNPITVRRLRNDIPGYAANQGERSRQYYPIFGVAVRFLVDPDGQGKTLIDIKNLFREVGCGTRFEDAFEIHMGMTLSDYERDFFDLMESYLPPECADNAEESAR